MTGEKFHKDLSSDMKYGVVQGRLSPQIGDFIQNFPDDWRQEFKTAEKVGASHIEWILGAPNVPIDYFPVGVARVGTEYFHVALSNDKSTVGKLEVPISAICFDWLVTLGTEWARPLNHSWFSFCLNECERLRINDPLRVVLPLLEASSMNFLWRWNRKGFEKRVKQIAYLQSSRDDVQISIETDLPVEGMSEFLKILDECAGGENLVKFTFDMGNLTKFDYDLHAHIDLYGHLIDNVHIKDCAKGQTVKLGTGDTNLSVLKRLSTLENIEHFTFQAARIQGLNEEQQFEYNRNICEGFLK